MTPEEIVALIESGICVFCFQEVGETDRDCPHCGLPVLLPEQAYGVDCPHCGQSNPLPDPLDDALECSNCGAQI